MDPTDLTKHLPEVASVAKVAAASIPFTGIVKRMLGPAADELAETLRDQVRLYRYERQLKCLEKAERMAEDAGFTPQAVPPKLLFPLLEGASFEEDENMHTMWAALLANAASPVNAGKVRPGFITALKQMSPDEAAVLSWIYDHLPPNGAAKLSSHSMFNDLHFGSDLENAETRLRVCMGGLVSAGLIDDRNLYNMSSYTFCFVAGFRLLFSPRGREFVQACRPPEPKS